MRINHNIAALNTYRQLGQANQAQQSSMEKLSSGLRINNASDDAAGLAISEKMRGQIRGLEQAQQNAQDGISLIQTAEGAMNETHSILQRMRELSVQAANDTNTDTDRFEIQKEINQLTEEITRIGENTEFNTKNLLDGSFEGEFQIGANEGQSISLEIGDMTAESLNVTADAAKAAVDEGSVNVDSSSTAISGFDDLVGGSYSIEVDDSSSATLYNADGESLATASVSSSALSFSVSSAHTTTGGSVSVSVSLDSASATAGTITANVLEKGQGISVMSEEDAGAAITSIQNALDRVSGERSKLGAYQNRLDHSINNLGTSAENLTAAESRIRDVDMAKEMMNQTKSSILSQASQSMLAQANQMPQGVLQLLR